MLQVSHTTEWSIDASHWWPIEMRSKASNMRQILGLADIAFLSKCLFSLEAIPSPNELKSGDRYCQRSLRQQTVNLWFAFSPTNVNFDVRFNNDDRNAHLALEPITQTIEYFAADFKMEFMSENKTTSTVYFKK